MVIEIRHFHIFCGSGGGASGFNRGHARMGQHQVRFRCLGGIDSDAAAVKDFDRLAGVPGTVLDLFSRDQYVAFHGGEPPSWWREATPEDLHRAAGYERPNIVFTSPPCKGFSGLLPPARAKAPRYMALNGLALRGVWLSMEAWADDPPEFFLLENVPRISQRGRDLLDRIVALLRRYGYATAETTHDCGELGGLAQTRKRFLLVARHQVKVPPFLYEPEKRPLRAVGDVLGPMPLPEDPRGGAMHRLPRLKWLTWVRLALIPAGGDWRALQNIEPESYRIMPATDWHGGIMGVSPWEKNAVTLTGRSGVTTGRFSVADPRTPAWGDYHAYGVCPWDGPAETVTGRAQPGSGEFSVADPRLNWPAGTYENKMRVTPWDRPLGCVTASTRPGSGAPSVADPRGRRRFSNVYRIVRWQDTTPTVTSGNAPSAGGLSVADPRRCGKRVGGQYVSQGTYGVTNWHSPSRGIPGRAKVDTGPWSVADPRIPEPGDRPDPAPVIVALDNTWHRPFTTLELAALQGFPVFDDETGGLVLEGGATGAWRERIGNAVPPPAAAAIASVMGQALLLAHAGETFLLSALPVWVRPIAIAASVDLQDSAR